MPAILRLIRWAGVGLLSVAAWSGLGREAAASLRVSPLVLEATLGADASRLGPVYVTNTARAPLPVRVELVGLTHDVEGYPIFLMAERDRVRAWQSVRPSWQEAELAPGESKALWFEPAGPAQEGAYLAALVSAPVPTGTLQVAVLLLLRGPQPPGEPATVQLEEVWAEQEAPGQPIEVVARVRNPHRTDGQARVEALIVGPGGSVQGRVTLGPSRLLPGTERLLRGRWEPAVLPPGRYVVQATLRGPGAGSDGRVATGLVDVVRPYELARLAGTVSVALRPGAGAVPSLVASLHNRGTRPVRPLLEVRVSGREQVAAATRVEGPEVGPGQVAGVEVPWPSGLSPGDYRVEVVWLDGARQVASDALDVTVASAVAHRPEERSAP